VDIPTVETVAEINEKEDTGESTKDDNKDATPHQGRLPPLQPLKVNNKLFLFTTPVHCSLKNSSCTLVYLLDVSVLTTV
jgi:hypothetical protein